MKAVRIEPEAAVDLRDAFAWYENRQPGLGKSFLDQLNVVQGQNAERPTSFPICHRHARRALLRRFPYLVLFVELPNVIAIVGVFHSARNPGAVWRRTQE